MATRTAAKKAGPLGMAILEQFADLPVEEISPEVARRLLKIEFTPADLRRVDVLSANARGGTLTPAEGAELDEALRVADLLSLLRSRASRVLKAAGLTS